MRLALRTFIETGRFGELPRHPTRTQIVQALGAPERVGGVSRRHRSPTIHRYGDVEFHFSRAAPDVCVRVYVEWPEWDRAVRLPARCELTEWDLPSRPTIQDVESYLSERSIASDALRRHPGLPPSLTVPTSGATFIFDDGGTLSSISVGA